MKLEDNSTHFKCAGCSHLKLVEDGHITKVAYNIYDSDSQKEFCYYSYNVMLCTKCYECKEEEKLGAKVENDGDNNTKEKKPA
jgi:hypothetical protein